MSTVRRLPAVSGRKTSTRRGPQHPASVRSGAVLVTIARPGSTSSS